MNDYIRAHNNLVTLLQKEKLHLSSQRTKVALNLSCWFWRISKLTTTTKGGCLFTSTTSNEIEEFILIKFFSYVFYSEEIEAVTLYKKALKHPLVIIIIATYRGIGGADAGYEVKVYQENNEIEVFDTDKVKRLIKYECKAHRKNHRL